MRKHIIETNETYFAIERINGGKPFITESPFFGTAYKVDHILDEFAEGVQSIFRINTETMKSEDITEEVAQQWLFRADNTEFGLEDDRLFPAYVRDSRAWACWKDDVAASAPVPVFRPRPGLIPLIRLNSGERV